MTYKLQTHQAACGTHHRSNSKVRVNKIAAMAQCAKRTGNINVNLTYGFTNQVQVGHIDRGCIFNVGWEVLLGRVAVWRDQL